MKKLLLVFALVVGAVTVSAQEVGSVWVGGSAGITTSKPKGGSSTTNYKFIPEVGYVLSDNLGVGVKLGYAKDMQSFGKEGSLKVKTFNVNPFVRYTFLKGGIGSLFVDGGIGYANSDIEGADKKMNTYELGFRPGVAINVTEKVSVLGHFGFLGYQHEKWGDAKTNTYGLDLDMTQFTLGVNVFF